ncbi:MAG: HAMP domain-containing histidine kinase [Cyclobacteriaceae bacterium]|nr:HAMP domain-containing histidine kinase [Cyclobacteriaceae bacterium]MCX7636395.1 HAMP domain-containing histidine kinase [Cyclobacteriaceae bacterium]
MSSSRSRLSRLLLGPDRIESHLEYKTAVLRAGLALLATAVGLLYIIIDRIVGIYGNEVFYLGAIASGMITLILNRYRYYRAANIIFLSAINLTIFLFADNDPYYTGIYAYFICTALTAFALFGYKDIYSAFAFSILSLTLFLIAYWNDNSLIVHEIVPPERAEVYLTINITVSFITCVAIIYFLIKTNRRSEELLDEQNKLLAKANAELDQFAYSVSHDLRAPLSSILGLINVYGLSKTADEKEQVISLISSRVHKLDQFIRDILNHSRNIRMEVQYEQVKPHHLVQEVLNQLNHMKDFGKQKIENLIPEELTVETDRNRLLIILSNLISNAVKYYDPCKAEPYIRIKADQNRTHWTLTISDNGIGIENEHVKNLFTMFYRAHSHGEGSGLGLYIVHEICRKMGGSVTVNSQYGMGTEFCVTLPNNTKIK